jgi:probable rRNA maturation factor
VATDRLADGPDVDGLDIEAGMVINPVVDLAVQDCWSEQSRYPSEAIALPWEAWFQQWLKTLQPGLSPIHQYELSLRLTTDAEIQALNHQYRQIDRPTDVLAFAEIDHLEAAELGIWHELPLYLGDIVISVDTAIRQATERQHGLRQELAWLAAHGLLHLLGWDHPDEAQLERMLNQQDFLLQQVGLPAIADS